MQFSIYSDDVKDFDDAVDRKFNVTEEYGHSLFDENQRIDLNNYEYSLEPYTYISIIAEMQLQIDAVYEFVHKREKIFSQQNGWNTK